MTTARKLLTADDLLAMPEDGKKYELVRGELIEMPPPGIMHGIVTDRIGRRIGDFAERLGLGITSGDVGIYVEQDPDTVRAPDYVFISRDRLREPLPSSGYARGLIPDLVVEVISPGYSVSAAETRARMWLAAGARLVVVAYIDAQEIVAYSDDGTVRRFGVGDTLTCDPVLPGFACPVAEVFAPL